MALMKMQRTLWKICEAIDRLCLKFYRQSKGIPTIEKSKLAKLSIKGFLDIRVLFGTGFGWTGVCVANF
jgi:hypothetical protein